jgi:hypothetical protein
MTHNQKTRFANLPIDNEDRTVRFTDPGFMMEDDLVAWREHLLETFRERENGTPPYKRPFRFLTMAGKEPILTMLKMGSNTNKVHVNPKAKKGKKGKKDALAKAKAVKRKAKSKKEVVSSEEGSDDESGEESEDGDQATPKGRTESPRPQREAGNKAKPVIARQAGQEAEDEAAFQRAQEAKRQRFEPTEPCPGKETSLHKLQFHGTRTIRMNNDDPVSLYLQLPNSMGYTTLPEEWKAVGWDKKVVSISTSCRLRFRLSIRQ